MARGRKPNLTVVGGPGPASAKSGHNSTLTDDQLQALTRQLSDKRQRLVDAEKKAKADRMNHDKVIKAELGAKGLADIKLLAELETEDGEAAFKEEMERRARVARWAGLSIGAQGSLFDDESRQPISERAFEDGKRAGLSGKDCSPSHAPNTEAYDAWVQGWHEGQAILAKGFKPTQPDPNLIKKEADGEPAGQDDFTSAASGGE